MIIATFVAWRRGHSIESLREAATASVTAGLSSIFILLAVGALSEEPAGTSAGSVSIFE